LAEELKELWHREFMVATLEGKQEKQAHFHGDSLM